MKSAITISLVPEAATGPFVFHCHGGAGLELTDACRRAAELGFDAVEIFAADAATFPRTALANLLAQHRLALAAVGTGAGWLRQGLSLSATDSAVRERAVGFVRNIIDVAADFGAPAVVGSMQGRAGPDGSRDAALGFLRESLRTLAGVAAARGQLLLFEPLNRYETDLFNRQGEAAAFLADESLAHVKLLCDLFHMNIEEADPAATLTALGPRVGHVHWADSNRRAVGLGHSQIGPIAAALAEIGFGGYLSAEVFPLPTPDAAAEASISSFRGFVPRS